MIKCSSTHCHPWNYKVLSAFGMVLSRVAPITISDHRKPYLPIRSPILISLKPSFIMYKYL